MGCITNNDVVIKSVVDVETYESKTESLSKWIHTVRDKAIKVKKEKKKNLRLVAMLSLALTRAESELQTKQRERAKRWARLQLAMKTNSRDEEAEQKKKEQEKIDSLWNNDLSSLNSFFNDLDNVKTVVAR